MKRFDKFWYKHSPRWNKPEHSARKAYIAAERRAKHRLRSLGVDNQIIKEVFSEKTIIS